VIILWHQRAKLLALCAKRKELFAFEGFHEGPGRVKLNEVY
jgi:hypothetical protein